MIWSNPFLDTWIAPGYRMHVIIRGYSCWSINPMRHLGTAESFDAATKICEADERERHERSPKT